MILDEPVNGLDPVGMREMQQVTDRIGVIADGRLVLEEDTEEIRRNHPDDIEDYLIGMMEGGQLHE